MVSLSELRELLIVLALIGGFSGAFLFFDASTSLSVNTPQAKPSLAPRVLGASTHIPLVANPVVHIDIPPHNIFEPN
ncbi:MAG: hypothetical protein A3C02_01100 [Candidatus Andersenbacteria bacterium RIFCSPHIGHO2_02_FULL_45_11]|uniref:Uncharacterized protein n=1 Tax=Candidatus Andersenbacteria bacterium RIFCSPHIGHO2_12_FULL_45_11 TaxID=1797281 RepID=A0A1G1X1H4_9BACT|nr:MAG: hypothetical protein A2805_04100 [Candidatus Andersenbacteria bacterium RIFCSPHIGHO2_01_FULL_46_36]OGY33579.1 MAG: hypothetical protein A3C02_01100 [Candidatus Andersenbacteria bacterium RIFCSPHIGHO2_02_FULL_45_11]OGY33859.1 MAG: hypothetical protein A3D99_03940 [Candidatus Andersenbacteria bacterium RIFCSPHIGHO2_12_FULL_45_11]